MNEKTGKFSKQTADYFSSVKEKMQGLKISLELTIRTVEDENQYIRITIDGKQKILSMEIADILINSKDKEEVKSLMIKLINQAIQEVGINNLVGVKKIASPDEYNKAISQEGEVIVDVINNIDKEWNRSMELLRSVRKATISKEGNVKIIMTGFTQIKLMEVIDSCLVSKNKESIAKEILETVNEAIYENQQEMIVRIEQINKGLNGIIN